MVSPDWDYCNDYHYHYTTATSDELVTTRSTEHPDHWLVVSGTKEQALDAMDKVLTNQNHQPRRVIIQVESLEPDTPPEPVVFITSRTDSNVMQNYSQSVNNAVNGFNAEGHAFTILYENERLNVTHLIEG